MGNELDHEGRAPDQEGGTASWIDLEWLKRSSALCAPTEFVSRDQDESHCWAVFGSHWVSRGFKIKPSAEPIFCVGWVQIQPVDIR
jgi:hypothetical protein